LLVNGRITFLSYFNVDSRYQILASVISYCIQHIAICTKARISAKRTPRPENLQNQLTFSPKLEKDIQNAAVQIPRSRIAVEFMKDHSLDMPNSAKVTK
jgi:hypothetical protein